MRKSKLLIILGIIVGLGLVGWGLYIYLHKTSSSPTPPKDLTRQEISEGEAKAAQNATEHKNYQLAADYYYGAASNDIIQKKYQEAKDLLQKCIKEVPDQYVPWYVYYSLATASHNLSDSATEKSSLQKAINKAKDPSSGADAGTITIMQKRLQAIK